MTVDSKEDCTIDSEIRMQQPAYIQYIVVMSIENIWGRARVEGMQFEIRNSHRLEIIIIVLIMLEIAVELARNKGVRLPESRSYQGSRSPAWAGSSAGPFPWSRELRGAERARDRPEEGGGGGFIE